MYEWVVVEVTPQFAQSLSHLLIGFQFFAG
jgi:hypothetical protein